MISDKQEHTCAGMQGKKYGRFISSTVVDHCGGGHVHQRCPMRPVIPWEGGPLAVFFSCNLCLEKESP